MIPFAHIITGVLLLLLLLLLVVVTNEGTCNSYVKFKFPA
jgi:uncharacterized integral membrane protein